MKAHAKKKGRPKGDSPPLTTVAFRADGEVMDAIELLTEAVLDVRGIAPGGARALAIRRALLAQAALLSGGRK